MVEIIVTSKAVYIGSLLKTVQKRNVFGVGINSI